MTCSGPSQLPLDFLARRLPAGAAAVVGAYRDIDPAPGPALAALAARAMVLPPADTDRRDAAMAASGHLARWLGGLMALRLAGSGKAHGDSADLRSKSASSQYRRFSRRSLRRL